MATPDDTRATELAELRIEVADAKGLPKGMARRLRGDTRAELEADAYKLAPHLEPVEPAKPGSMSDQIRALAGRATHAQDAAPGPEKPISLDGGARQSTAPPADMNQMIRRAAGR